MVLNTELQGCQCNPGHTEVATSAKRVYAPVVREVLIDMTVSVDSAILKRPIARCVAMNGTCVGQWACWIHYGPAHSGALGADYTTCLRLMTLGARD
jgi:hypothetical protein